MFQRHKYKDSTSQDWTQIKDPAATKKYDGNHDFMVVQPNGSLRFFSRRQSVHGDYPEHTEKFPQFKDIRLPDEAGNVYSTEVIHTGKSKNNVESHSAVSGILNSKKDRAIQTQKDIGPVRAVLLDVINPALPTYRSKLLHLKSLEEKVGKPDVFFVPTPEVTKQGVYGLIDSTRRRGEEGVIVTSLNAPEESNVRIKVKHRKTHNLIVTRLIQEEDIHGKKKPSMGSVGVSDKTGREVATVGSGFNHAQRKEYWEHPERILGSLIQVKSVGLEHPGGRLRHPVYNGSADGELDTAD